MSLSLLRRILQSRVFVEVESSDSIVLKVRNKIKSRAKSFTAEGKKPPYTKQPSKVSSLNGTKRLEVRVIDILRKIGDVTTPKLPSMSQLSASWATRRYFWAIDPSPDPSVSFPLRLSLDARGLDFHQKTLLSDEFGMGMGSLVMEEFFRADNVIDMSAALTSSSNYQGIRKRRKRTPDYLMWGANSKYYVVECKGCQTDLAESLNQLRSGLEQVRSIVFDKGPFASESLVVATFLDGPGTFVNVIDPPADKGSEGEGGKNDEDIDQSRESTAQKVWHITDPKAFIEKASLQLNAKLLIWAGRYELAAGIISKLDRHALDLSIPPSVPIETRDTEYGIVQGFSSSLFPQLGHAKLRVFTGVRAELLKQIEEDPNWAGRAAESHETSQNRHMPMNLSFGRNGTCMIVDGIDLL
jgi:hypothetical protein